MNKRTLLVVAYKFNDILYAISTEEFAQCNKKTLLIMYYDDSNPKYFPYQNLFDNVYTIHYNHSIRTILTTLIDLFKLRKPLVNDITIISNPYLIVNKFIIMKFMKEYAILVEDGLMNYYLLQTCKKRELLKNLILMFFYISEKQFETKLKYTYLLKPEFAKLFFGTIKQLNVYKNNDESNISNINKVIDILNNKKIFIGQPIYKTEEDVIKYNKCVNEIITKYKIDFYIPHLRCSPKENIKCPSFLLKEYGVTLEMIASCCRLEIFSFSSSLLYTIKVLNPENISHAIIKNNRNFVNIPIIQNSINDIIDYSNIQKKTK